MSMDALQRQEMTKSNRMTIPVGQSIILWRAVRKGPSEQPLLSVPIAWNTLRDAYHGRTRTHLLYLFSNLCSLSTRFDDRKTSLTKHTASFEAAWLRLAQNVATATADTDSMAAGIKNSTFAEAWKAAILLYLCSPCLKSNHIRIW